MDLLSFGGHSVMVWLFGCVLVVFFYMFTCSGGECGGGEVDYFKVNLALIYSSYINRQIFASGPDNSVLFSRACSQVLQFLASVF